MRLLFFSLFILAVSGCTSGQVWVISQADNGGTIGYHGYLTGPQAKEAVASKIPCRPYELNEDVEKDREEGADAKASKLPDSSIEDWHEVKFTCVGQVPAENKSK